MLTYESSTPMYLPTRAIRTRPVGRVIRSTVSCHSARSGGPHSSRSRCTVISPRPSRSRISGTS